MFKTEDNDCSVMALTLTSDTTKHISFYLKNYRPNKKGVTSHIAFS